MLTDIFAERYSGRTLWEEYTEAESKLLEQCFRLIAEQLIPYWVHGNESPTAKAKWILIQDRLSIELGLEELAPRYYSYPTTWMGRTHMQSGVWTYDKVCKDFVCAPFTGSVSPDRFMKERLSFVELAFRFREEDITASNLELPKRLREARQEDSLQQLRGVRVLRSRVDGVREMNESLKAQFKGCVEELNERLRRAGAQLHYHNGFMQVAADALTQAQIENPFWEVVADPQWKNVDIDMKEALDRRDAHDRDPAFYAARALESAIKIISQHKGWTRGDERSAHNYIDNLVSRNNGGFIEKWEGDALKAFFTTIRNPLSHGPGSAAMPQLTQAQTDWGRLKHA
jgi:hypothetical protein